jgi:nucleoside-diphosphate-sugar epimerase
MARTVGVTGISGLVGRHLAPRLLADPDTARIIGLDTALSDSLPDDPRLDLREVDVRDPEFATHIEDCDVVVHLAWLLDPLREESRMRSVNVDGTRNVLSSAVPSEVGHVIHLSSAVVYGAHPDNDFPLTEKSPIRANPDFPYAAHKAEVERWLWDWRDAYPDLTSTVLRPAIITGPGVDNFMTRQMEFPRFPSVRGYRPPWQFVHVDDVVSAIVHAIDRGLDGAYNVAAEGWLSFDEVLDTLRRAPLDLPEQVAFTVAERLWGAGLTEAPPGAIHYVMHPFVVSVDALMATGWSPEHTNREALEELAREHRGYITVRRGMRVRTRSLGIGAGAAGAALAALALRRVLDDRD